MKYRMLLSEYQKSGFTGRPPCIATLRNHVGQGKLPGEKVGGLWYVFVDENGEPWTEQPVASTGNALADRLLQDHYGAAA